MKSSAWLRGVLTLVLAFAGATLLHAAREPFVVHPAWLAEHLNDKDLVLIQVGDKAEYEAGHIPGAVYLNYGDISAPRGEGLALQVPPVEQLRETFEKLGVSDGSRIVVYFGKDWVTPTGRVFLTLEYLGLGDRTSLLDGGMPAWREAGQPVTAEVKPPARGSITPKPKPEVVADIAWVSAHLKDSAVTILDARHAKFYEGDPGSFPRGGHIPGALSIPYPTLLEESGKLKDRATLEETFRAAGVKPGAQVVTYCHIGQQASFLYFVARLLGYDARMYDGSFQEWSQRADLPVEPAPKEPPPDPHHDNGPYDLAAMYRHHFTRLNDQFSTGGQPPLEELARLKEQGIKVILDLQVPTEHDQAAEAAEAQRLGMRYFNIPVVFEAPKDEQVDEFLRLTDDPQNRPMFIHCAMAVRVGAFWMIRRVLRDGWSVPDAEAEAVKIGLGARHLREFALRYLESHKEQKR